MSNPFSNFGELLSNPLGDLISSIGKGVGEAQAALDAGSLSATLDIYREDDASSRTEEEQRMLDLVREIGYQPTFYVIPETEVEAQVSLTMQLTNNPSSPLGKSATSKFSIIASPTNAGNVNRYSISANAIAKLKFKIVPVPTPAAVSEMRVVPDLVGKVLDDATKALIAQLGFLYRVDGTVTTGTIDTQLPLPAAIGKLGDEIVLTLV
jgi:hypothetical protein